MGPGRSPASKRQAWKTVPHRMIIRFGEPFALLAALYKSDVKRFYNVLADERRLKITTIDNIHTVLHQVLDLAVDDDLIRSNPSNSVLKELKQSHAFLTAKRSALTRAEEKLFLDYLRRNH